MLEELAAVLARLLAVVLARLLAAVLARLLAAVVAGLRKAVLTVVLLELGVAVRVDLGRTIIIDRTDGVPSVPNSAHTGTPPLKIMFQNMKLNKPDSIVLYQLSR